MYKGSSRAEICDRLLVRFANPPLAWGINSWKFLVSQTLAPGEVQHKSQSFVVREGT
ncbi:MAG: hypothetical protein ACFCBU_12840 [Cyanophyceae cyanobacterium]